MLIKKTKFLFLIFSLCLKEAESITNAKKKSSKARSSIPSVWLLDWQELRHLLRAVGKLCPSLNYLKGRDAFLVWMRLKSSQEGNSFEITLVLCFNMTFPTVYYCRNNDSYLTTIYFHFFPFYSFHDKHTGQR